MEKFHCWYCGLSSLGEGVPAPRPRNAEGIPARRISVRPTGNGLSNVAYCVRPLSRVHGMLVSGEAECRPHLAFHRVTGHHVEQAIGGRGSRSCYSARNAKPIRGCTVVVVALVRSAVFVVREPHQALQIARGRAPSTVGLSAIGEGALRSSQLMRL